MHALMNNGGFPLSDSQSNLNLEEVAYRSIIRMILENRFRPGDTLLETELAVLLGLSRTPVSHALGRLVSGGFLQKRKKRGCIIPVPTGEDADQVFFARQVVESQAASTAARNASPDEIKHLWDILDEQEKAIAQSNKELYSKTEEAFHLGIVQAGKNTLLERFVRESFWHSNIYIFFFDSLYRGWGDSSITHHAPTEHRAILQAIATHDADGAARLMQDHIENVHAHLFKGWE
jgi:DNA-binding GntR family transcriptional regulator